MNILKKITFIFILTSNFLLGSYTYANPNMTEFLKEYYQSSFHLENGFPMLTYATFKGYHDIAVNLIEKGANPNENVPQNYTSPLMGAIYHQDEQLVKLLLETGAHVNFTATYTYDGHSFYPKISTPISQAMMSKENRKDGKKISNDLINTILGYGCDVNAYISFNFDYPENFARLNEFTMYAPPIMFAIIQHDSKLVEMLMADGANVNFIVYGGNGKNLSYDPLIIAITLSDIEAVKLLMECGANPEKSTKGGISPIDFAMNKAKTLEMNQIIDLLIKGISK